MKLPSHQPEVIEISSPLHLGRGVGSGDFRCPHVVNGYQVKPLREL